MDFISGLPLADGYDSIATFVDTFTQQAHFLPCIAKINVKELSRLYFNNTFKHHGLSRCIISDRDPPFSYAFWKDLMKQLRTKLNMSSAYHPQTDGQTKRTHRTNEQILRGIGQPLSILELVGLRPFTETMCLKYSSSFFAKKHLDRRNRIELSFSKVSTLST
jgi:hypothetical protein